MLSTLSCVCWQSVYLLWRNVYLGLLLIFGLGCLFFSYWAAWDVCIFGELFFFFNLFFYLLFIIYFWLYWVFVSVRGLSLVAASGGHSSSRCAGLSLSRPLLLWSTGSRCAGSVVMAHGPSCSAACGILPDQGSNPCPLHWQADSQPLRQQGSPVDLFFVSCFVCKYFFPFWGLSFPLVYGFFCCARAFKLH